MVSDFGRTTVRFRRLEFTLLTYRYCSLSVILIAYPFFVYIGPLSAYHQAHKLLYCASLVREDLFGLATLAHRSAFAQSLFSHIFFHRHESISKALVSMSLGGFHHHKSYQINIGRPPPLRTAGTYDDDEFFNSVALNLLSRYEALNLSIAEAICCTLVSPGSRLSFWEALSSRMARSPHMSPSTQSLVQQTHQVFAPELKRMLETEVDTTSKSPPTAPRHITRPQSFDKKKKGRRFFPDCDAFFRSRKVVDWSLTQTIQQVQSLQLDGTENYDKDRGMSYQPPQLG